MRAARARHAATIRSEAPPLTEIGYLRDDILGLLCS
jgi:hypothetical protein